MTREDSPPIRTAEMNEFGTAQTEDSPVLDLTSQAQRVLEELVDMMGKKSLGKATIKPERICMLLDRSGSCVQRRTVSMADAA